MAISVTIIADSVAPNGKRLTSFELVYPRFIHSELMTHRALSRNASSSRAIPIERMIQRVVDDPAMPVHWGRNQKGMQAYEELNESGKEAARQWWLESAQLAVEQARKGAALGLHKQICNRILEPFAWMTTLVTATEWANFFHLRAHPAADPTFQALAREMYAAYIKSPPVEVADNGWHLPYIRPDDWREVASGGYTYAENLLKKVSVGRCARVSYVNQHGKRSLEDDIALHDRLLASSDGGEPGHWSPFEHVATPLFSLEPCGNLVGWRQYRKSFQHENTTDMGLVDRQVFP